MGLQGKIFARKSSQNSLYKWAPQTSLTDKQLKNATPTLSCTATPGSNGQDFLTDYVYTSTYINGIEHRYAYVECGYVQ
jgi:hypothetical protein